jgi:hypothetical protein
LVVLIIINANKKDQCRRFCKLLRVKNIRI